MKRWLYRLKIEIRGYWYFYLLWLANGVFIIAVIVKVVCLLVAGLKGWVVLQ